MIYKTLESLVINFFTRHRGARINQRHYRRETGGGGERIRALLGMRSLFRS